MNSQSLERRSQKFLANLTLESGSPKNYLSYHTKIIEIGGYAHFKARFTFKWVELAMSANQILSQGLDVHPKIYLHFDVRIRKTPKMVCYIAH